MSAFVRMYEPHEAREDTVVFPALRDVLPAPKFRELAETFEDEEHHGSDRRASGESSTKLLISKRALASTI